MEPFSSTIVPRSLLPNSAVSIKLTFMFSFWKLLPMSFTSRIKQNYEAETVEQICCTVYVRHPGHVVC